LGLRLKGREGKTLAVKSKERRGGRGRMGLGENERVERKAKVGVLCGVVTCTYGVQDSDNTFLKH
jgi:hypothetical protein